MPQTPPDIFFLACPVSTAGSVIGIAVVMSWAEQLAEVAAWPR